MSEFTHIERFYPSTEDVATVVRCITVVEMPATSDWEKLFHLGGNYITFMLKGNIELRSNESIYDGSKVSFSASGTNLFEFKVLSDTVLAVVSMQPTAFSRIFGLSPNDYNGKYISAKTAIGDDLDNVWQSLLICKSYTETANYLFNWLAPLCRSAARFKTITDEAVAYIHSKNGCVKIQELTGRFRVSRRCLEKYFRKEIGISPALYTRTCRFASVLTLLQQSNKEHIDAIISILEYYDYSHFQKDFKKNMQVRFQDYIRDKQHPLLEFTFKHNSNFPAETATF